MFWFTMSMFLAGAMFGSAIVIEPTNSILFVLDLITCAIMLAINFVIARKIGIV